MPLNLKELRQGAGNAAAILPNRLTGRTYVPHPRTAICIETSARCNLACKFCAYPKRGPGGFMDMDRFTDTVEQAAALGYSQYWLTPMLGEVFADPKCGEKFDFLENHAGVGGFGFYTNFILPSEETIRDLARLTKLSVLHISIYGHDRETFEQVTRKPASQYDRLMTNLDTLEEVLAERKPPDGVHFGMRTLGGVTLATLPVTELTSRLRELCKRVGTTLIVADDDDNWGGTVDDGDVRDLGLRLTDGQGIYMHGACINLFACAQVTADGAVHACACRDVDGSLTIGNLDERPLADVLAWSNPEFRKIVEDQQAGHFVPNCRTCSMYHSVFDARHVGAGVGRANLDLEGAVALLSPSKPDPDPAE